MELNIRPSTININNKVTNRTNGVTKGSFGGMNRKLAYCKNLKLPILICHKNIYLRVRKYLPMRIRFLLFSFFMSLSILVVGQNTHPPYRQYTLRDGLSQMQVMSLFQDSRGYIWIGTKGGLNCFNGEKITSFANKQGQAGEYIVEIDEDIRRNIWASTNRGILKYDGQILTEYPNNSLLYPRIAAAPDGKIWYIANDKKRGTQFGYLENGRYFDQTKNNPEYRYDTQNSVGYDKKNNVLLACNLTKLFEIKDNRVSRIHDAPDSLEIIRADSTLFLFRKNNAKSWILFEYAKSKIIPVAESKNGLFVKYRKIDHPIRFKTMFDLGLIYLITDDKFETFEFPEFQKNSYIADSEGHSWLGTEEGLYQVFTGGFETYKREYLPQVWSMVEDLNGHIWFSSYYDGLKKFDGKTIQSFPAEKLKKFGQSLYFHPSVDKRGKLYFPGESGVITYDGQRFGHIDGVNCMTSFYDRDRDLLWVGSYQKAEAIDQRQNLVRTIGPAEGLGLNRYVLTISKDSAGCYWLGGGSGLSRYNWDTRKTTNYTRENNQLPANGVISIFNTPEGRIWFGSSNGLLYYDTKTDSIRKIEREEISGTVSFVSAIDSTWLVFSQSTGIYLMDLKKFNRSRAVELHLFNEKNGFLGIDPGQDGALADSRGNIWMTSSTEVVMLDPKKLEFNTYKINLRLTEFNGEQIPFGQKQLKLPRNSTTAIVQFETICYNRPKPAQYSWKIEGRDWEWQPWTEKDYGVLHDLPDGKTTLLIKTKIPGLPGAEKIISMPIIVSVALWRQAWFFPSLLGIIILLVIIALSMLFQARAKMVQINRQAKIFQMQAILSQMNPHFIFNVMASLQSMILSANIEKANEYLVKMSNLVRGFLEASVSTSISKSNDLKQFELPLQNALEVINNYVQFQQLIYPDKFDYEIFVDPTIDPMKQTSPPMLIQPFVENAIRHGLLQKADKGFLKISITLTENNFLNIEITDNGIGIKKASEMMRRSNLLYTSRGKELTLNRIKLLNEMGYIINFDSISSDQGTKVTITIAYDEKRNHRHYR
jgi:ligand-binding sensor domain-containing protein/anti-sigma regulatory factor (Ser/Thr protein kinase)